MKSLPSLDAAALLAAADALRRFARQLQRALRFDAEGDGAIRKLVDGLRVAEAEHKARDRERRHAWPRGRVTEAQPPDAPVLRPAWSVALRAFR